MSITGIARVAMILGARCAFVWIAQTSVATSDGAFIAGAQAYRVGDFRRAAEAFRESAGKRPASGTLQNLGNAEWQRGRTGRAILALEQALWVNPFDRNARNNLKFARESAQLEAPELAWYEVGAGWLPAHWWTWIAAGSLWLVVGTLTLPGILRWSKSPSQQAVAALGLAVFLLSIPAQAGVLTRSRAGFVLEKDTLLRLTPTSDAEAVARLAAGEPGRRIRTRGNYIFIRTNRAAGWVERNQFDLVCSK